MYKNNASGTTYIHPINSEATLKRRGLEILLEKVIFARKIGHKLIKSCLSYFQNADEEIIGLDVEVEDKRIVR